MTWISVDIDFMNFPVITGVKAFRHSQDNALSPVGEYQNFAGGRIEVDAFNFTDVPEAVEGQFMVDLGGSVRNVSYAEPRTYGVTLTWNLK